jgi:hypothetical protein
MNDAEELITTIEDAIRNISELDLRQHHFRNERSLLFAQIHRNEAMYPFEHFDELFSEILCSLNEADKVRLELIESLVYYRDILKDTPDLKPYFPQPPLMRRGGRDQLGRNDWG